jgi:tRNA (guanine37-N1)-methyltransferase
MSGSGYADAMRIDVITLFPQMFQGPLTESILQRAQDQKKIDIHFHDVRTFGLGKYRQVDDTPYGGGAGMVMRVDVIAKAIETVIMGGKGSNEGKEGNEGKGVKPYTIYFTPRGKKLKQAMVEKIAKKHEWLILLCGHYEGIDQRIIDGGWIDEEISIGDYVLTGGELPAMVLIDAVARHIPGVLGHEESASEESFSPSLERKKEYPHYTKPAEFQGMKVPDVLMGGNHAAIQNWRLSNRA